MWLAFLQGERGRVPTRTATAQNDMPLPRWNWPGNLFSADEADA
jgi:hypothetical protein